VTPAGKTEVTMADRRRRRSHHATRTDPAVVFFWLLPADKLLEHLNAEAAHWRSTADQNRQLAEAKDRGDYGGGELTRSLRIAAEATIRIDQALADWTEWARDSVQPTTS
jgi:hypothetical protein